MECGLEANLCSNPWRPWLRLIIHKTNGIEHLMKNLRGISVYMWMGPLLKHGGHGRLIVIDSKEVEEV